LHGCSAAAHFTLMRSLIIILVNPFIQLLLQVIVYAIF